MTDMSEDRKDDPSKRGPKFGSQYHKRTRHISDMLMRICIAEDWTRLRKALNKQIDLAAEGELKSLEYLTDRIDGKSVQPLANADDAPLEIIIRDLARERVQGD